MTQLEKIANAITEVTMEAPRGIIGEGYNELGQRIGVMMLVGPNSVQVVQMLTAEADIVADYNCN